MTTSHPATQLLEALLHQAPAHLFLEIRPLLPHDGVAPKGRRFFRLRQLQRCGFDQAVPIFLDGKANAFFGVLPRSCSSGLAADMALATCLWADLDKGLPDPWPAAAPLPSVLVETSPGKYQAYWLLQEPTADVDQVEPWSGGWLWPWAATEQLRTGRGCSGSPASRTSSTLTAPSLAW